MKALLTEDGSQFLEFPMTVSEISFEEFIDLRASEQAFLNSHMESQDEDKSLSEEAYEAHMASLDEVDKAKLAIDRLLNTLSVVCSGDLGKIPVSAQGDSVNALFKEDFRYTMTNVFNTPLTLMRLYCHVISLIQQYKPEKLPVDFTIEWKDNLYTINPTEAHSILRGVDYTAGEAITILDFQKRVREFTAEKGDADGAMAFNLGLEEVAVLLRKPGEKLPYLRKERVAFIDKRKEVFRDLPLDIVLQIRFFLQSITSKSETTQHSNSFSKGQRMKLYPIKTESTGRGKKKKGKRPGR